MTGHSQASERRRSSTVRSKSLRCAFSNSRKCHFEGTVCRCLHFLIASRETPASNANERKSDQRDSCQRSAMLNDRDTMSLSSRTIRQLPLGQLLGKAVPMDRNTLERAIGRRMKEARERFGWSQATMAHKMRASFDAYKKWEQRGNIPGGEMELFCDLTGIDANYLITGQGRTAPEVLELARKAADDAG